mmetsp:Transcript_39435/g.77589  ORF Transcript_39435/g.77589 Transcript_39435/m.77589 type:complete len:92 (-) Transcript_39435:2622-2897(-)
MQTATRLASLHRKATFLATAEEVEFAISGQTQGFPALVVVPVVGEGSSAIAKQEFRFPICADQTGRQIRGQDYLFWHLLYYCYLLAEALLR